MACATLKRSQNFDVLESDTAKRRRYSSFARPFTPTAVHVPDSPFIPTEPITQVQLKRRIKEEIKRLQRRRLIPRFLGVSTPATQATFGSHFKEENSAAVASCSGIFRSLALRSPQRDGQDSDGDQSPQRQSESAFQNFNTTETVGLSPTTSATSISATPRTLDTVPIFTLPQVTALCDRLIKEREDELRQEYDNILSCKLAEQYEAFLKFNHDQLYSRFQNAPMSYVS